MARVRAEYDLFARDRTRQAYDSATRSQRRFTRSFRDLETASQRSTRRINSNLLLVGSTLRTLRGGLAGVTAALSAGFAGAALRRNVADLEQLRDAAVGLESAVQEIGRLDFAFAQFNLTLADSTNILTRIDRIIEQALQGGPEADLLARLGLDPGRLAQVDVETRFASIAQAFTRLQGTEQAFVGQRLFEERFARLAPLLEQGAEGAAQLAAEFDRLAGPLEDNAESAKRIAGEFTNTATALRGLGAEVVSLLEEPLTRTLRVVQDLTISAREFVETTREQGFFAALTRDLALAAGELGAAILENVTGQELFNRELQTTNSLLDQAQTFEDFRAQRASLQNAGFARRNQERLFTEERVNELADRELDTRIEILRTQQRLESLRDPRRRAQVIGRETVLPGDAPGAGAPTVTTQLGELQREQDRRRMVELLAELVEINRSQAAIEGGDVRLN